MNLPLSQPCLPLSSVPLSTDEQPPEAAPSKLAIVCGRLLDAPFALLIFLGAALLAYAPVLGGGLVWDDLYLVGENPFFRSPVFGLEVFRHFLFFDSFSTYYRPVQNWSYMLDYWLWRGNPAGYHLTNALLHGGCGFLFYRLLLRILPPLTRSVRGFPERGIRLLAFAVAGLWLVHPVHNAAVAYISGRADSLSALFALSAWLLLLRARSSRRSVVQWSLGGASAAAMLLSLCAKEIGLVWLALFVLHELVFEHAASRRAKCASAIGLGLVLSGYAFLHALPAARAAMENAPPAPLPARVLLMLRALGDYAGLLVFPSKLYMERALSDPAALRSAAAWTARIRIEWLSVCGLTALLLAVHSWRSPAAGASVRRFGILWFVAAFLPISNLFPLNAEVAEHWIYLASMGALLVGAGWVVALPPRWQPWAGRVALLAAVALAARTAVRSADWQDAETFCRNTIATGGGSPRILSALAGIYGQRGDWARQEHLLRKTLELYPAFAPARMNLGICLARQGRAPEAANVLALNEAQAESNARQYPRTWPAALQLAQLRSKDGDTTGALAIVSEAQSRFPEVWPLVKERSELAQREGGAEAGLRAVEAFGAAHWWLLDAQLTTGLLRQQAGDLEGAAAQFRAASRLDIYDPRALTRLAAVELLRHRETAALDAQCEAMARDPGRPAHYLELAQLLSQMGREREATAALRKAQRLAAAAGG